MFAPASDSSLGDPVFKDLLGTASDQLKDDSDTPDDPRKHEQSLTLSAMAAIFAAMLPATPAGSFGLPSQGDQAGPAPDGNTRRRQSLYKLLTQTLL